MNQMLIICNGKTEDRLFVFGTSGEEAAGYLRGLVGHTAQLNPRVALKQLLIATQVLGSRTGLNYVRSR